MAPKIDQPCMVCGAQPTVKAAFVKMQGMLILRRTWWANGYFCRDCGLRTYQEYQSFLKAKGWWSISGVIGTPIFIMKNNASAKKVSELQPPMRTQQYAPQA